MCLKATSRQLALEDDLLPYNALPSPHGGNDDDLGCGLGKNSPLQRAPGTNTEHEFRACFSAPLLYFMTA